MTPDELIVKWGWDRHEAYPVDVSALFQPKDTPRMNADDLIRSWHKEATQMRPDDLAAHFHAYADAAGHVLTAKAVVPQSPPVSYPSDATSFPTLGADLGTP